MTIPHTIIRFCHVLVISKIWLHSKWLWRYKITSNNFALGGKNYSKWWLTKNEMIFNQLSNITSSEMCYLNNSCLKWHCDVTITSSDITSLKWLVHDQSRQPMSLLDDFFLQFHWSIMDWDSFCFLLSMFIISLSPYFKSSFTHQTY